MPGPWIPWTLAAMASAGPAGLVLPQDPPAATRPAAEADRIHGDLLALASPDPRARDAARRRLLAVRTQELTSLLEALGRLPPELTSSTAVQQTLYDAVVHIHLREAKQRMLQALPNPQERQPFLGVALERESSIELSEGGSSGGVPVRSTMPGFRAYELLESGDLLVGVRTPQGFSRLEFYPDLRNSLTGLSPGDTVEFQVIRGGETIRVEFTLDTRVEYQSGLQELWAVAAPEARREAEAFWERARSVLRSSSATAGAG